jgi:hypothetical protein
MMMNPSNGEEGIELSDLHMRNICPPMIMMVALTDNQLSYVVQILLPWITTIITITAVLIDRLID